MQEIKLLFETCIDIFMYLTNLERKMTKIMEFSLIVSFSHNSNNVLYAFQSEFCKCVRRCKILDMIGPRLFYVICLVTSSKLLTRAEEESNNSRIGFNETQSLKVFPGVKFSLTDGEIIVNVRVYDLLQGIYVALFALVHYISSENLTPFSSL